MPLRWSWCTPRVHRKAAASTTMSDMECQVFLRNTLIWERGRGFTNQIVDTDTEGLFHLEDQAQGRHVFAALNLANVGPFDAGLVGQLFLIDPRFQARGPHGGANCPRNHWVV